MGHIQALQSSAAPAFAEPAISAVVHVVDYDDEAAQRLSTIFVAAGFEARTHRSVEAFLVADRPDQPGCLVVDAQTSRLGGARLQPQARPIVVMAEEADVAMAVRAMKAGAIDFLQKPPCEADMLSAVGAAMRLDQERRLADAYRADLRARLAKLTPREREVMMLVATGKMNKQVAGDLGLSEITVKVHRGSAMRKMRARTLADLVRMADAVADPTANMIAA